MVGGEQGVWGVVEVRAQASASSSASDPRASSRFGCGRMGFEITSFPAIKESMNRDNSPPNTSFFCDQECLDRDTGQ